ncbi:hypothetical protein PRIPAC_86631, partial [Pristionchus pacificus]|uniref:G protein-coupled receptor n=1 Tax=Pristionchus pacificus TaxID=54126 RepID=A0A2A6BKN4_PRIPA
MHRRCLDDIKTPIYVTLRRISGAAMPQFRVNLAMAGNESFRYGFDIERAFVLDFSMKYQMLTPFFHSLFNPVVQYLLIFESKTMMKDIRIFYILTHLSVVLIEWILFFGLRLYVFNPFGVAYCEGPLCTRGIDKQILLIILGMPIMLIVSPFIMLMARMHQMFVPVDSVWHFSRRTQLILAIALNVLVFANAAGICMFGRDCDESERLMQEPELVWLYARGGTLFLFGPPGQPQYFKWELMLLLISILVITPFLYLFTADSIRILKSETTQANARRMLIVFFFQCFGSFCCYILPLSIMLSFMIIDSTFVPGAMLAFGRCFFLILFQLNGFQFSMFFIFKNPTPLLKNCQNSSHFLLASKKHCLHAFPIIRSRFLQLLYEEHVPPNNFALEIEELRQKSVSTDPNEHYTTLRLWHRSGILYRFLDEVPTLHAYGYVPHISPYHSIFACFREQINAEGDTISLSLILGEWIFYYAMRVYPMNPYAALYCEGPLCSAGIDKQILAPFLALPTLLVTSFFIALMARMHQMFLPNDHLCKLSSRQVILPVTCKSYSFKMLLVSAIYLARSAQLSLLVLMNSLLITDGVGFGYFYRDHDDSAQLLLKPEMNWIVNRGGTMFIFGTPGDLQHFKWELLLLGLTIGLIFPVLSFVTIHAMITIKQTTTKLSSSTQAMALRMFRVFLVQALGAVICSTIPMGLMWSTMIIDSTSIPAWLIAPSRFLFLIIFTLNGPQFCIFFIVKNPAHKKIFIEGLKRALICRHTSKYADQKSPVSIAPSKFS